MSTFLKMFWFLFAAYPDQEKAHLCRRLLSRVTRKLLLWDKRALGYPAVPHLRHIWASWTTFVQPLQKRLVSLPGYSVLIHRELVRFAKERVLLRRMSLLLIRLRFLVKHATTQEIREKGWRIITKVERVSK